MKRNLKICFISLLLLIFVNGCTEPIIGGLAGAGVGQLIGGDTESTLIGAGIGTAVGYVWGNEKDKKASQAENEQLRQQIQANQAEIASLREQQAAAASQVNVYVTNSDGSLMLVTLTRSGPGFLGPSGEYYPGPRIPDNEMLRNVYGW